MGSINSFKPLSTFFQPAPLIKLNNVDNFSSERKLGAVKSNPGQLGPEASTLTIVLCCSPLLFSFYAVVDKSVNVTTLKFYLFTHYVQIKLVLRQEREREREREKAQEPAGFEATVS